MSSLKSFFIFIFTTLMIGSTPIWAVPPLPGSVVSTLETCRINTVAQKSRMSAIKAAPFFPVPLAPTTAYVAVLRVDFSDQVMTKTKAETETFFEALKAFYLENSYGVMTVSATVTTSVHRLPQTHTTYAQGLCSVYSQIAHDSVGAAGSEINFANGAPSGGRFDHIMIYHSGIGAETASDAGCQTDNIWSVFAPTVPAGSSLLSGVTVPFSPDGVAFNGVTVVPESENFGIDPLGVIAHEYGHQLGLPDLYVTPSQSAVGSWSLMDSGIYIGSPQGSNPAHLDAWSKQFLGFFRNPQTITVSQTPVSVPLELALSSNTAFLRIPISGVPDVNGNQEYFLVERRARSSLTGKTYDDAIPLGNLEESYLIWHVDDDIASDETRLNLNSINNGSPHLGVDLVEADGGGLIALTDGDAGDAFPGNTGRSLFAAPHSNAFNGLQTGIALSGFSGNTLTARSAFASNDITISKVINFPNPGGPAYPQKSGAPANTITTVVLNVTKAPDDIVLTIHDLSGALVRDVPAGQIRANGDATLTNKFVFEYDWDGRNDSGEKVASGVYLYRFRVDDEKVKTGKMVLIR